MMMPRTQPSQTDWLQTKRFQRTRHCAGLKMCASESESDDLFGRTCKLYHLCSRRKASHRNIVTVRRTIPNVGPPPSETKLFFNKTLVFYNKKNKSSIIKHRYSGRKKKRNFTPEASQFHPVWFPKAELTSDALKKKF